MNPGLAALRRPQALLDLEAQAGYIAISQPASALRLVERFEATVERLRSMPRLGREFRSRSRRLAGIRYIGIAGFRSYLIFYRVHADSVEILRVLHASRDLSRVLREDTPS